MSQRKSDVSTRMEDDGKVLLLDGASVTSSARGEYRVPSEHDDYDSDEDVEFLENFDIEEAWDSLINASDCSKVVLTEDQQKDIGVEIGVNVTGQYPWKQVKLKVLTDYLFDEVPNTEALKEKFQTMSPDDLILIGYIQKLSKDKDLFLIFETYEAAKDASEVIKNIESYERWVLNKALIKRGHRWKTRGSEREVDLGIPIRQMNLVDVEVQSVYPSKHSHTPFSHRYAGDIRDGYVELVPGKKKFKNVFRKRIDVGIQSAPPKIDLEQQTDPTFPTNAWSQYLYEIDPNEEGLESSDDDRKTGKEDAKKPSSRNASKNTTPVPADTPIPPNITAPEVSDQIKNLLSTLEFNQVDMYRNDYPNIAKSKVQKFTTPYLEEILCFANISKSYNRFISGLEWYPTLSGLVVSSYAFSTQATTVDANDTTDVIRRTVMEPNPILMWSFDDSLNFKLEFESPREITCLSFCPYNENLLFGGTINGQIIIWDLQNKVSSFEAEEVLTSAQIRYRHIMRSSLDWSLPVNVNLMIRPTAITCLENSQTGAITAIKWLHRNHYIMSTGQARASPKDLYAYFVTSSMDGSVFFWNLDAPIEVKKASASATKKLPPELVQDVSEYKKMDGQLKPQYIITHPQPLTSMVFDAATFSYTPLKSSGASQNSFVNIPIKVTLQDQEVFRQKFVFGSMTGGLHSVSWEGFESVTTFDTVKENVENSERFACVHDGPVIAVERNPFYPELLASIGGSILAIWKEELTWSAVLHRKCFATVTTIQWSNNRPSVLFLTKSNGTFEVWDFLSRTDTACLIDTHVGNAITAVREHRSNVPRKILGIGDSNSSLRMLVLPQSFDKCVPNELEHLKKFVEREECRKTALDTWQKEWCEKNQDIREAKKAMAEEAQLELEKLQKQAKEREDLRNKREAEEARRSAQSEKRKVVYDLPERLEKKWDESNLRRLVSVLMTRKMVDPVKLEKQTALEKERLSYEKSKRIAIKKSLKKIDEDVAAVRARLLPIEKEDFSRIDQVKARATESVRERETYTIIEKKLNSMLESHPHYGSVSSYSEFLKRGQQRRQMVNKSVNSNLFERRHAYEIMKQEKILSNIEFTYQRFKDQTVTPATMVAAGNANMPSSQLPKDVTLDENRPTSITSAPPITPATAAVIKSANIE